MENRDKKNSNNETECLEDQDDTSVSLQISIDSYVPQTPEPFPFSTSTTEDYAVPSTSSAYGRKMHRTSPADVSKMHSTSPADVSKMHRTSPADVSKMHRTSPADVSKMHTTSPCGTFLSTKKTNLNIAQSIPFEEKLLYSCAFRLKNEEETENVQLTSKEGYLNMLDNISETVIDEEAISQTENIFINYLAESEEAERPDSSDQLITYQQNEEMPTVFSSSLLNHQGTIHDETEISVIWKKDCRKWLWKNKERRDEN